MTNEILERAIEATRLTRLGRLQEATALLQRGLMGQINPGTPSADPVHAAAHDGPVDVDGDVIEGTCREVGSAPASEQPEQDTANPSRNTAELDRLLQRWKDRNTPRAETQTTQRLPGTVVTGSYANAAGERSYKLYVPSRYAGQPLPLIMMLHGCHQSPDDFAAGTRMNKAAEAQGCFVLYPAQSNSANAGGCWNWFRKEDQSRHHGEPSLLAGMTGAVMERYSIAAERVYAAGLSAGGAMAAVLGVTYPDVFAAVGIHSGLACGSAHDLPSALSAMKGMPPMHMAAGAGGPAYAGTINQSGDHRHHAKRSSERAVPTIVFHGDRDRTVHPRNGANVVAQSPHNSENTRVSTEKGRARGGHAYTKRVHRDDRERIVLEYWVVHGGGHSWFGGSREGSHTDPRGPDATREMMRFFMQVD